MKKMPAVFLLLVVAVVAGWAAEVRAQAEGEIPAAEAPAEAPAEDPGFGVTVSLDTVGTYWWRGYDLSHSDPASLLYVYWSPSALPGLSLSTGVIYGWSKDESRGDTKNEIDEWDLSATYSFDLVPEAVSATVGFFYYDYTSEYTEDNAYGDSYDSELSLGLAYTGIEWLTPSLTWYRGLDDNIKGNYFELALAASVPLGGGEAWSLGPKLATGWSSQYGVDKELTNLTFAVPLTWSGESFSVTPSVNWVHVFEPETLNYNDDKNELYGALNVSFWF